MQKKYGNERNQLLEQLFFALKIIISSLEQKLYILH